MMNQPKLAHSHRQTASALRRRTFIAQAAAGLSAATGLPALAQARTKIKVGYLHTPAVDGQIWTGMQTGSFARQGLDLSGCHRGTLNLAFAGGRWCLRQPSWCFEQLRWTDRHPPETFSFWPVLLRWCAGPAPVPGWLYRPHPETKRAHHQPPDRLEVLAPWIEGIAEAQGLELGVDGRRCRLVQPATLSARLLEFLKFRVLAAQACFFEAFAAPDGLAVFRRWLADQGGPGALDLTDAELLAVLEQARRLYLD
jgi:hypothetical protein